MPRIFLEVHSFLSLTHRLARIGVRAIGNQAVPRTFAGLIAVMGSLCPSASTSAMHPSDYSPLTVGRQLTHILNQQKLPTNDEPFPAPNGRELVIESNRSGKQQLYVISVRGQLLRRLTSDSGTDDTPSWSHDGRHIAYISIRHDRSGLYVINADGRSERRLAADGLDYLHPTWSRDAFERNDLWVVVTGRNSHCLPP